MSKKISNSENDLDNLYFNNIEKTRWKKFTAFLFRKRIFLLLIVTGIIFVYLFAASIFTQKNWIVSGGSTSVEPIMNELSPWYLDNYNQDFIYNSMGSASAPVGVINGYYSLGMESQKIDINTSTNYKTFTIAQDYFIIFFNLPNGLVGAGTDGSIQLPPLPSPSSTDPNLLGAIMKNVYSNETWLQFSDDVKKYTGVDVFVKTTPQALAQKITTFTRESGSGTRDYMEKDIIGQSGSTNNASVQSSNGGMMNAVASSDSSMGYISFSYIQQIMIDKLVVASINSQLPYVYNSEYVFNSAYSLKRPFAGLINLHSKDLIAVLNFINRILYTDVLLNDPSYDLKHQLTINPISEIIYKLGFEPSTYNQYSYTYDQDNVNDDFYNLLKLNSQYNIDPNINPF